MDEEKETKDEFEVSQETLEKGIQLCLDRTYKEYHALPLLFVFFLVGTK